MVRYTLQLSNFVFHGEQPLGVRDFLINEASLSHSDTPHSVGLLWTSDQFDAETSTWQYTTLTRTDIHAAGWILNRNPIKSAAANPRFTLRGHRDRQLSNTRKTELVCRCRNPFQNKTIVFRIHVIPIGYLRGKILVS
jgi:hypothetical protein